MGFDWLPAKNYKRHFICLNCQKGFKKTSEKDLKNSEFFDVYSLMNQYYSSEKEQDIVQFIEVAYQKLKVVCPNCKNKMLQVHYNFEVPSKNDSKSWKTLKKEMQHKMTINFDVYLQWHQSELKKQTTSSDKIKALKENLAKLENQSKN